MAEAVAVLMADHEQNGSVATIRELHALMQERDERHENALAVFRTEMTARLDIVLANQQRAEVVAAERNGKDDARIDSLEMAVKKVGDDSALLAEARSRISVLEQRADAADSRTNETNRQAFIRGIVGGAITALGTSGIYGVLSGGLPGIPHK